MVLSVRQHTITIEITGCKEVWIDLHGNKEEAILKTITWQILFPKLSTRTFKCWHSTLSIIIGDNLIIWKGMMYILLKSKLLNPRLFTQVHSPNNLRLGFKSDIWHAVLVDEPLISKHTVSHLSRLESSVTLLWESQTSIHEVQL